MPACFRANRYNDKYMISGLNEGFSLNASGQFSKKKKGRGAHKNIMIGQIMIPGHYMWVFGSYLFEGLKNLPQDFLPRVNGGFGLLMFWVLLALVKINRDRFLRNLFFFSYKGKNIFSVKQTDLYFPVIDVGWYGRLLKFKLQAASDICIAGSFSEVVL